jgi:hypothetical protein
MSRPRSDDLIILRPDPDTGEPIINPWILKADESDKEVRCYELQRFGDLGKDAIRIKRRTRNTYPSMKSAKGQLRDVFGVIEQVCKASGTALPQSTDELTKELTNAVLDTFAEKKTLSPFMRAKDGQMASRLLQHLVGERFIVRVVPTPNARGVNPKTLAETESKAVLDACREDVERIGADFARINAILENAVEPSVPWRQMSLEDLLSYFKTRMNCVPHSQAALAATRQGWFSVRVRELGMTMFEFYQMVFPRPDDAVPFILLLIAACGANDRGFLDLKTNSLIANLFSITKYRGHSSSRTKELVGGNFDDIAKLMSSWHEISKRARAVVSADVQDWLWIILKASERHGRLIHPMNYVVGVTVFVRALRRWCKRHGFSNAVAEQLAKKLRKDAGARAYKAAPRGSISEQIAAIRQSEDMLDHVGESPACYGLALITPRDVDRAVNRSAARIHEKLVPYIKKAEQAYGVTEL